MKELRNTSSKTELKKRLRLDDTTRTTVSFYRYHSIDNPENFRDELYENFEKLEVFGRIYIAREGINAQISVPTQNFESFKNYLHSYDFLENIRLNVALEDDGKSFAVLHIRVKEKIVADGINDPDFSVGNRGEYLNAAEFNELTANDENVVVVDMRNHYEYEVGHFENAVEIPSDTFREQLPMAAEMLADKKDRPVIMYCTGGIRCEKASAYLKYKGFEKVFHLEGGIIEYVRQVKAQNLKNKFLGKNFVFDDRLSERIGDEIISHCHQCGEKSDTHTNCANRGCHLLFIQCEKCREKFENCCGTECQNVNRLPEEEQRKLRSGQAPVFGNSRKLRERKFDNSSDK